MSFGGDNSNLAEPAQKPLGQDVSRASTAEEARPVPWLIGRQMLGVTFISDFYREYAAEVTSEVGKSESRAGFDYYASFAAAVCMGPVDFIYKIQLNGEMVWSGSVSRASNPTYANITLPRHGPIRVYWGTDQQIPDAHLATSGEDHPAYRGLCYIVFMGVKLGFNQTSAPNIEVEVRKGVDMVWRDANPADILLAWLTDRRTGLGRAEGLVDLSGANYYLDASLYWGLSALVTRAQEARSLVKLLCDYLVGYPTITNGVFSLGLIRPAEAAAAVAESDLVSPPELQASDWTETRNETHFKFVDRDNGYKEALLTYRTPANLDIQGDPSPLILDRTWCQDSTTAGFISDYVGKLAAVPEVSGRLRLRMRGTLFADLAPGTVFTLTYAPRSLVDLMCRVTERAWPDPARPQFEVGFVVDRTYFYKDMSGGSNVVNPQDPEPEETLPELDHARVVELPLALCPDGRLSLAVLAARNNSSLVGFTTHLLRDYDYDGAPADSYERLAAQTGFAKHGTLLETYPVTGVVDDAVGFLVQLDGVDTTLVAQTPFDGLAGSLLVWLEDEIISVSQVELVGDGLYRVQGVRGRFASTIAEHAQGAEVWVMPKGSIKAFSHLFLQPHNTATIKVQPQTGRLVSALDDVTPIEHEITGSMYTHPPVLGLTVNGDAETPSYGTGEGLTIAWVNQCPEGDYWDSQRVRRESVLEAYDGETLLGELTAAWPLDALAVTNEELLAWLGSEQSFTLRVVMRVHTPWSTHDSTLASLAVTLNP